MNVALAIAAVCICGACVLALLIVRALRLGGDGYCPADHGLDLLGDQPVDSLSDAEVDRRFAQIVGVTQ